MIISVLGCRDEQAALSQHWPIKRGSGDQMNTHFFPSDSTLTNLSSSQERLPLNWSWGMLWNSSWTPMRVKWRSTWDASRATKLPGVFPGTIAQLHVWLHSHALTQVRKMSTSPVRLAGLRCNPHVFSDRETGTRGWLKGIFSPGKNIIKKE